MTVYAKFKTTALVMEPTTPAAVPLGSIFNDSTNSSLFTNKTVAGDVEQVGATTSSSLQIKLKYNNTGSPILAYKRVALLTTGGICLADSDNPTAMLDIGLTLDEIADGAAGRVLLNGPNAAGALTGLGFAAGDIIYLSKTPGSLTNSVSGFDPSIDTIMKVGIADCESNIESSTATDLIMEVEVVAQP